MSGRMEGADPKGKHCSDIDTAPATEGPGDEPESLDYERQVQDLLEELDRLHRRPSWYSTGPSMLLEHLYLGDFSDAASLGQLAELGITHLLNCACAPAQHADPAFFHMQRAGYQYLELDAADFEDYDMTQHFAKAFAFIQEAKESGGKVLVYCKMGMNRSATVCIAYMMAQTNGALLDTVRRVRKRRASKILTNTGFQRLLVRYAKDMDCLESKWKSCS